MSSKHPTSPRRAPRAGAAALATLAAVGLVAALAGSAGAAGGFQAGVTRDHKPSWGTNRTECPAGEHCKTGRVWDTVTYGGVSYLAGEFEAITPVIDRSGALDGASGLPAPGFPSIDKDGSVNVATPDGVGGWYVGGTFSRVNGVPAGRMARITADGTLDTNWNPEVTDKVGEVVHALAKVGSLVYVGGQFTQFQKAPILSNIARVSEATGLVERNWNPDANGPVLAVAGAPDQSRVYIAGEFSALKGGTVPAPGLAALDAAGNPVAWNPGVGKVTAIAVSPDSTRVYTAGDSLAAIDAASGAVIWRHDGGDVNSLALTRDGGTIYAGGGFNSLGGQPRARLAAVNAATGAIDPSWNPETDGPVSAVTVSDDGTRVFVGGAFSQVRGQTRNRLAALDAVTGTLDAWDPNADGQIDILAASGSRVYASGTFSTLGSQPRTRLGAIDIASGGPHPWAPQLQKLDAAGAPEAEPPVALALALSPDASKIYVGGNFSHVLGANGEWLHRENLVAVDRVTGLADPGFNPGRSQGTVRSLAMYGNTLYAGGDFDSVRVSNTDQGSGRPDNPCPAGQPDCETLLNSAGNPNGSVSWHRPGLIAAFDGTTGVIVPDFDQTPASTGPGLIGQAGDECSGAECGHGAVKSIGISADGTYLYAGGTFSDLGGQLGMFAANLADGSLTAWQPSVSIPVFALDVGPDGQSVFTSMGGAGGKHARFNPHTGAGKDAGKPAWLLATDGDATAVDTSATTVFGGGHYDFVAGAKHKHAVALSLDGKVADNWDPVINTNEGVFTVEVVPGQMVILGGNFSEVGIRPDPTGNQVIYKPQPGFAMFPGNP